MKIAKMILAVILLYLMLVSCSNPGKDDFVIVASGKTASVFIAPGEPEFVKLAAHDLISDVEKITGNKLNIVTDITSAGENCIVIGSVENVLSGLPAFKDLAGNTLEDLEGKWESYSVKNYSSDRNYLLIAGSNNRGTMFGIYDFTESYLGVDPMYFWTDREPKKQKKLFWKQISILQEEPTYKYRGWFINDEDLLTEWKDGSGPRYIDYPFYSQVAHPEITEKVVEALVRLRYNLFIPASFIDIGNPPEKKLVDIAAKRGIFLSMHHIEPMGVNAFTFFNYWKAKGKDYKFSYYQNPQALEEIWRVYAEKWAEYPNVIWQIGLRGIADRPMWLADPTIPESDALRGKLISDAMKKQVEIIKSVDKRSEIPISTTLWMEGSALNRGGYLKFPENVMVIFSDNSPGWVLQSDFYENEREPGRKYGIYYHHALWGSGPHIVQGVSPFKAYDIFKQAVEKQADHYAILNVSNVREFPLGLKASSEMLYNFTGFNPDFFLKKWCAERFGKDAVEAEAAYRQFFDSYQVQGERNIVFLLDGQMRARGLSLLKKMKSQISNPGGFTKEASNLATSTGSAEELISKIQIQKEGINKSIQFAEQARKKLKGESLNFLEVNLISQQRILLGLTTWLESLVRSSEAVNAGDFENSVKSLEEAVNAFNMIRSGQELNIRGEKWENWYRGDKKINLINMEKTTTEVLEAMKNSNKPIDKI